MAKDCYVCKEEKGMLKHLVMFKNADGIKEVELPVCKTCSDNYTMFQKVLKIFMIFCTVVAMAVVITIAYAYGMSGNKDAALYTLVFIVPVSFLGYYITKRLHHSSHFIQKAAQEPTVKKVLEQGYKGFILK